MHFLLNKLRTLRPGESTVYFVGFLEDEKAARPKGENSIIADTAYSLAMEGKIHLTQKRLSHPLTREGHIDWHLGRGDGFKYIATGAFPKIRRFPIRRLLQEVSS